MARGVCFTDLDGTLLNGDGSLSSVNQQALHHLADQGVLRVAATGRSLYSARKVLDPAFPIDVLIFSSGPVFGVGSSRLCWSLITYPALWLRRLLPSYRHRPSTSWYMGLCRTITVSIFTAAVLKTLILKRACASTPR
jgi:hypothetical protein